MTSNCRQPVTGPDHAFLATLSEEDRSLANSLIFREIAMTTSAHNPREQLRDRYLDATCWLDILGETEAILAVNGILDSAVTALRRDPRMPRVSLDLILAGARRQASQELTMLIEGKGHIDDAIERIVDELLAAKTVDESTRREVASKTERAGDA